MNIETVLALAFAVFISWFLGRRSGKSAGKIEIRNASEKAEKERKKLDEEINADTDLVARAHAAGVVRKP